MVQYKVILSKINYFKFASKIIIIQFFWLIILTKKMFTNSLQECSSQSKWKQKQTQYQKDSVRKIRQDTIQSHRYLHFSQPIQWRMNIESFRIKVESVYNYYTLLETLFEISQEPDWRSYIPHMNLLVSTFHNIMCSKNGSSLQDIGKIKNFQIRFQKLFLLRDHSLHEHLMLLLKMLLAYNSKYNFLKQTRFSQILMQSTNFGDENTFKQVFWILSQIEVSNIVLSKILKHNALNVWIGMDEYLLPILIIIANFIASSLQKNQSIVQQLILSDEFNKIFQTGLSSNKIQIINQTILIFNNGICYSPRVRNIMLQENVVNKIMTFDCPQKYKCQQILTVLKQNQKLVINSTWQNGNNNCNIFGINYQNGKQSNVDSSYETLME